MQLFNFPLDIFARACMLSPYMCMLIALKKIFVHLFSAVFKTWTQVDMLALH